MTLEDLTIVRERMASDGRRVRLFADADRRVGAVRVGDEWHATGPYVFAENIYEELTSVTAPSSTASSTSNDRYTASVSPGLSG